MIGKIFFKLERSGRIVMTF